MKTIVCLSLAFLFAAGSAHASTFFPDIAARWQKKIDHYEDYDMDAFFVSSLEGEDFEPYEGQYDTRINSEYVISGRCRWNPVNNYMLAPTRDEFISVEDFRLPWFNIIAKGPTDPNTPDPLMEPLEDDDVILNSTMFAAGGMEIPLQLRLLSDLSDPLQLPSSVNFGQGTWQVDWGDLSDRFTTLQGRYYLVYAENGIRVGDFVPEPGTGIMVCAALAALALRQRR